VLLLCWALSDATALGAPESKPDAPLTQASPVGLDELMDRFAASGGVRARFRETKHLALLAKPLETERLLFFALFGEVEPDRVFLPAELDRIFSLEEPAGAP
jgi:hypothetical protein